MASSEVCKASRKCMQQILPVLGATVSCTNAANAQHCSSLVCRLAGLRFGKAAVACLYLWRVRAANKAVDHLHGVVDSLKLHKGLVLYGTSIEPDAHYTAKGLAQLHDVLFSCIRR